MTFTQQYLTEAKHIIDLLNIQDIEKVVELFVTVRKKRGRLFILGVGGSAANASHAVNDFRKIANIEAYAPTDNISELTARINDEGWETVFSRWLATSRLNSNDLLFILSVGGGDLPNNVSPNLVCALQYAKSVGASVSGIVSRDGGYTALVADAYVLVPVTNALNVTPHAEAFQAIIWHLLVSHPKLKRVETKWESLSEMIMPKQTNALMDQQKQF